MAFLSYTAGLWLTIAGTVLHVIAISVTAFRLNYRRHIRRLWWDDYVAGTSLVVDIIYVPMAWFAYGSTNSILYDATFFAVKSWILLVLCAIIIWLSRISFVLALARVFPPGEPIRRFCIVVAHIFVLFLLSIIIQLVVQCPSKLIPFGKSGVKVCNTKQLFGFKLSFLILELISGAFLVATPLYKLWRVRLPTEQRRLILTGFATSILTTLASVICVVFLFLPNVDRNVPSKINLFEAAVAVLDCNFLVIITYIHTRRRRGEEIERTVPPETCSDTSNGESVSHSNHVPNSSQLTTLSLTQITVSYDYVHSQVNPQSQRTVLSSGGIVPSSTQNFGRAS